MNFKISDWILFSVSWQIKLVLGRSHSLKRRIILSFVTTLVHVSGKDFTPYLVSWVGTIDPKVRESLVKTLCVRSFSRWTGEPAIPYFLWKFNPGLRSVIMNVQVHSGVFTPLQSMSDGTSFYRKTTGILGLREEINLMHIEKKTWIYLTAEFHK